MLTAFSIKLERIDESLLYRDPGGGAWLSCVCTLDTDSKGRKVVAQSIPKERYAAGERGPVLGVWKEIGKPKPPTVDGKGFDLSKFKAAAQSETPQQENLFASPEAAFDAAQETQREPQQTNRPLDSDLGF